MPVAPGTAMPLRYHCTGVPAGLMAAVKVAGWPGLIVVVDADMLIMGCVFTVMATLAQAVVLQVPSALTK